jgi:polyphosphate kinase
MDPQLKRYLKDVVLTTYLSDNVKARVLNADGVYERVQQTPGENELNSQLHFEGSLSLSV